MKISPVNLNNYFKVQNNFNKQKTQPTNNSNPIYQTLNYNNCGLFIPFGAGISLNLSDTYAAFKDGECPKEVEPLIQKELNRGNPDNKTLNDIHFERYKGVLDCYTLEELKEKYPEFKDVISANSVIQTAPGSILDDYLKGTSNLFPQDEDLTLQLVKLYWGQGFSLTDLEKHTASPETGKGRNLHYLMTAKLNIPLMTRHYASILKLSDREYNEKFALQMSIKLKEAQEAKQQHLEGEPVVIPKGPLSEAHRKHISEGLIRYYATNPDRIYSMSDRQKKFYEENPKAKERLSYISDYAWNKTKEGRAVKYSLTKFAKKQKAKFSIDDLNPENAIKDKSNILVRYLNCHPQAKDQLSKAMKESWDRYTSIEKFFDGKSIVDYKVSFNTMDTETRNKIAAWAKDQGYKLIKQDLGLSVISRKDCPEFSKYILDFTAEMNGIISAYDAAHKNEADLTADVRLYSLIMLKNFIEQKASEFIMSDDEKGANWFFLDKMFDEILESKPIYEQRGKRSKAPLGGIDNYILEDIIQDIMTFALEFNCVEIGQEFDKMLDEAYQMLKENDIRKKRLVTT